MNEQNSADIVQLFMSFCMTFLDTPIAQVVGPYLLITFAAVTGAFWSLKKTQIQGCWSTLLYFIRIVAIAVVFTSVIVNVLTSYVNFADANLWIAPVALVIGVLGDDWLKVFTWLFDVIKKIVNQIVNKKLRE